LSKIFTIVIFLQGFVIEIRIDQLLCSAK